MTIANQLNILIYSNICNMELFKKFILIRKLKQSNVTDIYYKDLQSFAYYYITFLIFKLVIKNVTIF